MPRQPGKTFAAIKRMASVMLFAAAIVTVGCDEERVSTGKLETVWGRRGNADGRFQKPRAMAIDANDHLYIVDMTARIQVFDREGSFLRGWQTPVHVSGRPTGLSFDRRGRLMVADTHYYRVLFYSPEGELVEQLGGVHGQSPGEFGLVTDAVEDSSGNLYVSEYGEYDRIQKFSADRKFLLQWGGHGDEPGHFMRPQSMAVDEHDNVWVADACNHRIQEFDGEGHVLNIWGEEGSEPGQLYYPYGIVFDDTGHLYVAEWGNNRVQKFSTSGESLGCWGHRGRQPGELDQPWALVRDSQGRIHVLDTMNHRVQRVAM